jgi:hypothetical protein
MNKYFLLTLFLFSIASAAHAQYTIKKKLAPDSLKSKSDFLPRIQLNTLDSLRQKSLTEQKKADDSPMVEYSMPMYKPDPSVGYNMPMVKPSPNVHYKMPMFKGPDSTIKEAYSNKTAKDTTADKIIKTPKKNRKHK